MSNELTYVQNLSTVHQQLQFFEGIQDNYSFHVRQFTTWIRSRDLPISEESVHEYMAELNRSDYCANTKRIKRQAVKKRLKQMARGMPWEERARMEQFLKDLDYNNETAAPKVNSVEIGRDKCITVAEYQLCVHLCRSRRQQAFFKFLMNTACRVGEMTGIKIGHCKRVGDALNQGDPASSVDIRVVGKGNKERHVRVSARLYDFVRETFRGEEYLFETEGGKAYSNGYVTAQIKKIGKLIGKNISAHTLRHSRITSWVQNHPGSLDAISRYVGHSNVSITLGMYCHSEMSSDMLFDLEEV